MHQPCTHGRERVFFSTADACEFGGKGFWGEVEN